MKIITLDFETYYSREYSLTKMTTEEYIRHDLFEVIGVSVKVDDHPVEWFSGTKESTHHFLKQFPWEESVALAHNTMFDGAILSWIFDIHPKILADTMSMARPLHGHEVGGSLKKLVLHYGVGEKGDEVIKAMGKRRVDFTPEELAAYGSYCCNDTELTYKLFHCMVNGFPKTELKLIDLTLKMFTEPVLQLDALLLEEHLHEVKTRKEELLARLLPTQPNTPEEREAALGTIRDGLMSNPKFAEVLMSLGVEPPVKTSPRTGKEAYAFAKTDPGLLALQEHPSLEVQAVVSARLGVKSTIEETRTQRFLDIANRGALPIPLRYFAAHTSRWGGTDQINLQNLPSRGENAGKLKSAILPPPGHVIIDSDSAQIEARILAWLSGQEDLVEAFRRREDVYSIMASAIYCKPVGEISKQERFVGKTVILGCLGADTKVLTNVGWKPIIKVKPTDLLWDGQEWVTHQGVIQKGEKEMLEHWGVNITPDHEILTEHGWREWSEVVTSPTLSQSAIAKALSLSWIGNSTRTRWVNPQGGTRLSDATVDGKVKLTDIISRKIAQPDVILAQSWLQPIPARDIGGMRILSLMKQLGLGSSIGFLAQFQDAIQKVAKFTLTMVGGGFTYSRVGVKTVGRSFGTSLISPGGTTLKMISTGYTTIKGTSREICALSVGNKTSKTGGPSKGSKQKLMTYDIAFCGPRNRFTIATTAGPLIVHNCGYGTGAKKLQETLKRATPSIDLSLEACRHIVNTYRNTYRQIPALWAQGDICLAAAIDGQTAPFGRDGVIKLAFGMFHTPLGIPLRYPGLRRWRTPDGVTKLLYTSKTGKTDIWGGKLTENLVQHLARIIIGLQLIRIAKRYRVVMTVHDAIACVARAEEAQEAQAYVEECMRWVPEWAEGLPLNCESGVGANYGQC